MCTDIEDLEQECEDVLFELCDIRERYPAKCADELEQCFRLKRLINMKPPKNNMIEKLNGISITDDQKILFQHVMTINKDKCKNWKQRNHRFENMLININDMRIVMEQINNEKLCPIKCVIKDK